MSENDVEVRFGAETSKFKSALSDVDDKIDGFFARMDQGSGQTKAFAEKMDTLQSKFNSGKIGINDYAAQVEKLGKSFSVAENSMLSSRNKILTLQYTASDVVASLASGASPMTILLQQGGQVAQVFGGASLAIMGFGAAVGLAAYGIYEFVSGIESSAAAANTIQMQMSILGKVSGDYTGTINMQIDALSKLRGVNEEQARQIETVLAKANGVGIESMNQMIAVLEDYSAFTGQEPVKASVALVKAMGDISSGSKNLQEQFNNNLNPEVLLLAMNMDKAGEKEAAQIMVLQELAAVTKNAATEALGPMAKAWDNLKTSVSGAGEKLKEYMYIAARAAEMVNRGYESSISMDAGKRMADTIAGVRNELAEKAAEDARALQAKNEENAAFQKALNLATSLKTKEQERLDIVKQIEQFRSMAGKAKSEGKEESYKELMKGAEAYQEKLNKIYEAQARQSERSRLEAERAAHKVAQSKDNELQGIQQISRMKAQTAEQAIQLSREMGAATYEQEYASLKDAYERQYQEDMNILSQRRALWQQGSDEWNRITIQMESAHEALQQNMIKAERQRVTQQKQIMREYQQEQNKLRNQEEQEWRSSINSIVGGFGSGIKGMIMGQKTLLQATGTVVEGMLTAFIGFFERKAELWIMDQVLGETTAATSAFGSIMSDAARAGAAAYASTAAIPIIGPGLAPAAGAQAYSTTAAYSGLLAFEQGADYIPNDMTANIHKGERIVPKADNERLMKAVEGGGSQGGGAVHLHVHAMDSRDVKRFLSKNNKQIGKSVQNYIRGGGRMSMAGA